MLDALQKHLKLYKIRRKVNITPCLDLSLWAVVPGEQAGHVAGSLAQCADRALILTPDPRTEVMGWRLITKKGANVADVIPGSHIGNIQDYHRLRYKQGKAKSCFTLCVTGFWKICLLCVITVPSYYQNPYTDIRQRNK